jgi:hypothetical protein
MKKSNLLYSFIDPNSGGYSASRMASIWLVVLDSLWVAACLLHIPPVASFAPVSSLLGTCTAAAFAAYGMNSFGRTFGYGGGMGMGGRPHALPKNEKD